MNMETVVAHDGVPLRCRRHVGSVDHPWLILIVPFGLDLKVADAFFDHFGGNYNIATWESRLILSCPERKVAKDDFSTTKHVRDLFSLAEFSGIDCATVVGYCSGAGVALAAANNRPEKVKRLVLVHGEFAFLDDEACMTQVGTDIDSILPLASRGEDKAQFILDRVASLKRARSGDLPQDTDINLPFSSPRYLYRYALNYLAYRETGFERLGRAVSATTLVMAGEADRQTNVCSARRIGRVIQSAQVFIDKDADHYGILRPQSNTLKQIERFLLEEQT